MNSRIYRIVTIFRRSYFLRFLLELKAQTLHLYYSFPNKKTYFKEYQEKIAINIVGGKKWNMISGMLWLSCYNLEVNWKIRGQDEKMSRRV